MPQCHLIHGIRSQGLCSVEKLAPYIPAGVATFYPDYGFIDALETRIVNGIIVGAILPYIGSGDIIVAHSNGCAIAYELMARGAPVAGAAFINAALESDFVVPPQVKWIDVYYNPGDVVTEAAKLGAELGIVDTVWGECGHQGYTGPDARVTSINCFDQRNMPTVWGHSDLFSEANLPAWAPAVVSRAMGH